MPDAPRDFAALWRDFARRVDGLSALVLGEGTPTTTPAERSAVLPRRSQSLQRRYAY